jgi:hypothetical protein
MIFESLKKLKNKLDECNRISISREDFFQFIKIKKDSDDHISKETQHYLDYFDKYQKTKNKKFYECISLI